MGKGPKTRSNASVGFELRALRVTCHFTVTKGFFVFLGIFSGLKTYLKIEFLVLLGGNRVGLVLG